MSRRPAAAASSVGRRAVAPELHGRVDLGVGLGGERRAVSSSIQPRSVASASSRAIGSSCSPLGVGQGVAVALLGRPRSGRGAGASGTRAGTGPRPGAPSPGSRRMRTTPRPRRAVHGLALELVRRHDVGDARDLGVRRARRELGEAVVLADEDQRQLPQRRQVDGLVEVAGLDGAVAEEHHGDRSAPRSRQPARRRPPSAGCRPPRRWRPSARARCRQGASSRPAPGTGPPSGPSAPPSPDPSGRLWPAHGRGRGGRCRWRRRRAAGGIPRRRRPQSRC